MDNQEVTAAYSAVDPFWGNGATQSIRPEGLVRGWNWLKAQTGNTHPGATLPFGWVSVCPYSGAYPTGYGTNDCTFNGPAKRLYDRKGAWGISHFHMSGTGFVGQFYNYLLCTPRSLSANTSSISTLTNETARPGYYAAAFADYGVDVELTAAPFAAVHRYRFHEDGGHLSIDINAIGLRIDLGEYYHEQMDGSAAIPSGDGSWKGSIYANGVTIWFALKVLGQVSGTTFHDGVIEFDFASSDAEVAIGFSLISQNNAEQHANKAAEDGFDAVLGEAVKLWKAHLGRVRVDFPDDALQSRFYSALYHSLVRPAMHDGGYIDFVTMWDTYRTQLPLALSISREHARPMLLSMLDTIERFGFFPILYYMNEKLDHESNQASALVVYTLCDGFMRGILTKEDYPRVKSDLEAELRHADFNGKSPTHILDIAGAFHAAAIIARFCGDGDFADLLEGKTEIWRQAYDEGTGYLVKDAIYYEGNYRNYSFRAHVSMAKRIELAGGTARFNEMLDDFFAIGHDIPPTDELRPTLEGFFEGMNNESDMEAPATYLWCGRSDRFAEINDLIRRFQFTDGDGGAPGNVDSGALSSWYVWSCLGLYPLTGTQYYLLGSPAVTNAEVDLAGGTLIISVTRESPQSIYPIGYIFNGRHFTEPWLPVADIEKGGRLEFKLADKPSPMPSPIPSWL